MHTGLPTHTHTHTHTLMHAKMLVLLILAARFWMKRIFSIVVCVQEQKRKIKEGREEVLKRKGRV